MILAIDCGNTHITIGCVDSLGTALPVFRIPADPAETEFGYAVKIKQILDLEGISLDSLSGAAISCVVPPMTETLVRAAEKLTHTTPLVVGAGVKTGLHICINDPGTIASDLVIAAVAAKAEYPLPCAIIDMGTATTVTLLDEKGRFIGGAILPGTKLSLDALAQRTALLPFTDLTEPKSTVGTNTVDCMKAGILYGSAGAVDGLLDRFEEQIGTLASIVATGGLSRFVIPHCRHTITEDETLLLKGLRLIWNKNHV